MLLVHSNPLAIRFRIDEKRFDVDGAYNARYEIIKKRVDKANIKGMAICEAFREYHKRNAKLELVEKIDHRQETSEEIKFNTALRNKIKETE